MKRFMVIASVAAMAVAEPEADPQFQWPGGAVVGPFGTVAESTCFGCRPVHFIGKREAEPHGAGVAFHPTGVSHVGPTTFGYPSYFYGKREAEPHYGATSFVGRTIFGYPRVGYYGKRSAEPHGTGVAFHPTGVSHVGPTTYGSGVLPLHPLHFGKRAAEPQFLPAAPATFSSGSSGYGKRSAEPHGLGVAVHPGLATSFVGRTVHGLPHYGKRDAEAEPEAAPEAAADAEADADAFYGLYGYAAPYGVYGGYGYGWPGGYTSVSGLYGYPYWG